jgi:hypothetical protein
MYLTALTEKQYAQMEIVGKIEEVIVPIASCDDDTRWYSVPVYFLRSDVDTSALKLTFPS